MRDDAIKAAVGPLEEAMKKIAVFAGCEKTLSPSERNALFALRVLICYYAPTVMELAQVEEFRE